MAALPAFAIPLLIGTAGAVGGAVLSKALAPKAKPIAAADPRQITTRSAAMDRAATNDILSRRKGTDANRRVGFGAGEAFTGPKRSLLGRS